MTLLRLGGLGRVVFAGGVLIVLGTLIGCTSEEAAPESTTSSTIDADPETTTSTTLTTTTPSTTVDPIADAEAAVETAYLRSYEVFTSCLRSLPDCEPDVAFAEVYTGETYDRLVESVSQSRTDGLVYEAPENPDHARTEILDLAMSDDLTEAVISICTLAGDTELLISPDGSRNRVGPNNTILIEWGDAEMVLGDDGVWRITNYSDGVGGGAQVPFDEIDEQLEEGLLCGGQTLDG